MNPLLAWPFDSSEKNDRKHLNSIREQAQEILKNRPESVFEEWARVQQPFEKARILCVADKG